MNHQLLRHLFLVRDVIARVIANAEASASWVARRNHTKTLLNSTRKHSFTSATHLGCQRRSSSRSCSKNKG